MTVNYTAYSVLGQDGNKSLILSTNTLSQGRHRYTVVMPDRLDTMRLRFRQTLHFARYGMNIDSSFRL